MSEWKEYRLGDIVSIASGFAYKGEYIGRGEKFLLGMGCVSFKDKFLLSGAREYAGECADRYYANVGDLVLATRQQSDNLPILGMPAVIPIELAGKKIIIGANLYRVVNNSEFSNKYLYWLLKSPAYIQHIAACKTGTTVSMITKADVENFVFLAPGNEERCRIEETLNSLDDKIDLLNRENATLEALAETLFRHYFIEKPNSDWKEGKLGDVAKIGIGRTPPRKETKWFSSSPMDVKWISIKDMGEQGVFIFNTTESLTKDAVETFKIPTIPPDTVVLSFKMTVGRIGITTETMLSNEAIAHFILDDNSPISKEYLYIFLKLFKFETLGSTSSIVTSINSAMIKEMELIIPDKDAMMLFNKQVCPLFEKIKTNQQQILSLSSQRDTLLPRLMSSEVKNG